MEIGLTAVLRLLWAAATLPIVLASLPLPGLGFLRRSISDFAARGKTVNPSSRRFTVPQSYFRHFYALAVALTSVLLLLTWFYAYMQTLPDPTASLEYSIVASHLTGGSHVFLNSQPTTTENRFRAWRTVFILLLMEAQVIRRSYETCHVFDYSPSARMHILGYITGIFFYTVAPLSLCSSFILQALSYGGSQLAEFIVKGQDQMPVPMLNLTEYVRPFTSLGWSQWIGAVIYLWGWFHQLRCHSILGSLRQQKGGSEYVIPHGDWFDLVSCPHYLAEIVIYVGILIASGGSDITVWLLLSFVVANLVFAAVETHRWYHRKFDSYPRSRRAIIPFIY